MTAIDAKKRTKEESLIDIRAKGSIPAVFYGAGKESTPISVPLVAFQKALKEAGESSTIELRLPEETVDVLIHDIQFDPVKDTPVHADFLVIDMKKPIEVDVELEFTGVAPAVKNGLGSLVKVMHEIQIKALPKDLPHSIEVDISSLETLENQIHVKDLVMPKGVTCLSDENEVVALVAAGKEEVEEVAAVDLSAIEVEKKGKKEEEGAEAGDAAK
jgi:large subunit ribosomal protein L25